MKNFLHNIGEGEVTYPLRSETRPGPVVGIECCGTCLRKLTLGALSSKPYILRLLTDLEEEVLGSRPVG